MNKDVNRELYSLNVESYAGSTKPGVLATIGGKFSTSAEPSRNDRMYSPDLWRSVVSSDRVKEMLDTKTFYGELSHPPRAAEFLSEVQMSNISHNITKLNFDEKTQDLIGTIDILDTPSGQIANTLLKYGSKIGISSRGIVMDNGYSGGATGDMTPENYYLVTFDLVALPGITGARLDRITESLTPKFKSQLALESLQGLKSTIDKAKESADAESLQVLKSIVESVKESYDDEDDELDEVIKELSVRDDSSEDDTSDEVKDLMVDDNIDREDVDAAVLEKKLEETSETAKPKKRKRRTKAEIKSTQETEELNEDEVEDSEVDSANEDDSGATQASDIEGPTSTINMMGPNAEVKKFLEAFEGIHSEEDLVQYLESVDAVETKDGKVVLNKDTVLFNTMLNMINTLRLHSDANPLLKTGTSITNMDDLEIPDAELPDREDDPTPEPSKLELIKKSINKDVKHRSSLESTFRLLDKKNDQVASLVESVNKLESVVSESMRENELLKSKIKTNYASYNESLTTKDKKIKELSIKASDAEKLRKQSANEAVNSIRSYKQLASANETLKSDLSNSQKQVKVLQDKVDKLEGYKSDSRKDSKLRKLIEARELSVVSISNDEHVRTANESSDTETLYPSDEQRLTNLLNSKYRNR